MKKLTGYLGDQTVIRDYYLASEADAALADARRIIAEHDRRHIAMLAEAAEQSKIIGAGGERELALMAKVERLEREFGPRWQPISTAPTDTTYVLAYRPDWADCYAVAWYSTGSGEWERSGSQFRDASHWIPLPAPPQQPKDAA